MGRLDGISLNDLHELRGKTEGEIPRERVLAAIGRKQGDTLGRLAERHDVAEKTIRNWLDRFAEEPLSDAPYDAERPGRPPKLSDEQYSSLLDDFQQSPKVFDYNRQGWTSKLAAHHIKEEYGIEYTLRHTRNIMKKAGLSWRSARPRHTDANPDVEAEFKETVEKNETS